MKRLIIARFTESINEKMLCDATFFSELTERELQNKISEIIRNFRKSGFREWTVKDIIKELKKEELVEEPEFSINLYDVYV